MTILIPETRIASRGMELTLIYVQAWSPQVQYSFRLAISKLKHPNTLGTLQSSRFS
jgi:hypothetical protein